MANMDYDDVVKKLGKVGRFECLLVLALAIPSLFYAPPNLGIVFLAGIPEHRCRVLGLEERFNLSDQQLQQLAIPLEGDTYSSCQMYAENYSSWTTADVAAALDEDPEMRGVNESPVGCQQGWIYDQSQYQSTIVSEWDLVCDNQWMRATVASFYYVGMMAGVLFFGTISDMIGRKKSLCIATLMRALVLFIMAWAPNYTAFIILRLLSGLFGSACYINGFVMTIETVSPTWRVHASTVCLYMWTVSYMGTALLGYLIRDWFTLQLVIGITSCPVLLYIWFLPESPRWLFTKHHKEEGNKVINRIARFNKVELPENMEVTVKEATKGYLWDVFRTPRMKFRFISVYFIWCVISLIYYDLSLNSSNLGGNDYISFFIAGAVEVPAYVCSQLAMSYLGRRLSLTGTMLLGGLALFAVLFTPVEMTWPVILMGMTGKFAISMSFAIAFVFTAELFPTIIRNVGVGAGSFFSRIGAITAPYLAELGTTNKVIPPLIFGCLSIAAGLLALLLPETKGKHLSETLEEGENFEKNFHPCGSCSLFAAEDKVTADYSDKASNTTKLTATITTTTTTAAAAGTNGNKDDDITESLISGTTTV